MSRRARDRVLLIAGGILAALLCLSVLTAAFATVREPNCSGCHTDVAESHAALPHAEVACISCHGGTSRTGRIAYRLVVMYHMRMPFLPFVGDTAAVDSTRCTQCHDRGAQPALVASRGIRINHRACTEGLQCVLCHGGVGHELTERWASQYSMNQCLRCHLRKNVYSEAGCEQCHDGQFDPLVRTTRSSFALVHGANWQQTHGMGDLQTCAGCHQSSVCARCHGELVPHDSRTIIAQHGRVAKDPQNQCASCHRQQAFCDGCHGIEMPHPDGFLQEHSTITRKLSQAVCDRCHLTSDCTACHHAHIHPGGATP